jgi:hypothetical protein
MTNTERPFTEIKTEDGTFRFFGKGEWQIRYPGEERWLPMIGTLVPTGVLHIAAEECRKQEAAHDEQHP